MRTDLADIEAVVQTEADREIGPLAKAARGGLAAASRSIADCSHPSVVIVTGAYVPWAQKPAAETDGPPGAALLAAGFSRLGIPARLLTDSWCSAVVAAASSAAGLKRPIDVCGDDEHTLLRLVDEYSTAGISHVIAIERLGPARDGRTRNFRGEDVTRYTPFFGSLFQSKQPWKIVGIGDGGNEIGMGAIPTTVVVRAIKEGAALHCRVGCDHLVVAGVSNWALLACCLAPRCVQID